MSLNEIVDALVEIPELNDASMRRDLVTDLRAVRSSVTTGSTARGDILNLVQACARLPTGKEALVGALATRLGAGTPDIGHALEVIEQQWPTLRSSSIVGDQRGDAGFGGYPVDQWSPGDLGVHPVVMPGIALTESPISALTEYVLRPHDAMIARILPPARSMMVIFWGDTATGKTRAALEAVRRHLPDWPVLRPVDAEALVEQLRGRRGDRVVIWLDRVDTYLDDDEVATALRRHLAASSPGGPGQTVVMATAETGRWRRLKDEVAAAGDRHALRALLEASVPVPVPDAVTGPALQEWRRRGRDDARLALAADSAAGRLVQALTGGRGLIERYEHPMTPADAASRTVVTAMMDLRRLGHASPVDEPLLIAAVGVYSAAGDDGPDPQQQGIPAALRSVDGVEALTVERRSGDARLYHLHVYLEQFGRERRSEPVPAPLWDVLIGHDLSAEDALRIARSADRRGLYRHAVLLATVAVDQGMSAAARQLSVWLERTGHVDDAFRHLERCAAAGDVPAIRMLGEALLRRGDRIAAEQHLRNAAADGDSQARLVLVALLERSGRADEVADVWREGARAGDPDAQLALVEHLTERGADGPEVASLLNDAAAGGDLLALNHLVQIMDEADRAAPPLDGLEHRGTRLLRRAAREGSIGARRLLVRRLTDQRRLDEAITECRPLGATAAPSDLLSLARLLDDDGRPDEAEQHLLTAAEAGVIPALTQLSRRWDIAGRSRDADALMRRVADAGHPMALRQLTDRLRRSGREEAAEAALGHAAERGNTEAMRILAGLFPADAELWLGRAAARNDTRALRLLVALLDASGRVSEGTEWLSDRARNGDAHALRETIRRHQRNDDPEPWLRYAVEAGAPGALNDLAMWLADQGRHDEANQLRRFGVDPGGRTAAEWA